MKKIVVATNNPNKLKEFQEITKDLNLEIVSKADIGQGDFDVEETEKTLEGNSLLKARGLKDLVGDYIVIADDSGLFVDYLGGAPGVNSARYSGEGHDDEANKIKLLKEMEGVSYKDRTAYFKTVIAMVEEGRADIVVEGLIRGHIAEEERGSGGFGYDPLFVPEGYNKTFAELGRAEKNKISHRSRALRALYDRLKTR